MRPTTLLVLATVACSSPASEPLRAERAAPDPAAEAPDPAPEVEEAPEEAPEGARTFGAPLDAERDLVALADIAGDPERFAGQTVKTEGEITAVCQRMGCWMEMRAEGAAAVRVPMAGHSFFLPRDVSGRHATIEGEVALRELSQSEREHLESEGAELVASALQISATGVVID